MDFPLPQRSVGTKRKRSIHEESSVEQLEQHERTEYTIGWLCALPIEFAASTAMLDSSHADVPLADGDSNAYALGQIQSHYVVMTVLPHGSIGTNAAATVARDMVRSFSNLRFILLVGIGGGAPDYDEIDPEKSIRLGDVVVSKPMLNSSGIIQYDFGKALAGGVFDQIGTLNKPPASVRSCVSKVESKHLLQGSTISNIIAQVLESDPVATRNFGPPPAIEDRLFEADYNFIHGGRLGCQECDIKRLVHRETRLQQGPVVHYGIIASANQVMKDAATRDKLRREKNVICFEMEAAGLIDNFPCLVIRGICDYADSHKVKQWQPYASLTAAAYAKELLQNIPSSSVKCEATITMVEDIVTHELLKEANETHRQIFEVVLSDQERACFQLFNTSDYEAMKNRNPDRADGTCQWVLANETFQRWDRSQTHDLLWVSADPGCGKSVLARSLIEKELKENPLNTVCYFFFKDNDEQDRLSTALCALIHQILRQQKHLIKVVLPIWQTEGEKLKTKIEDLWRVLLTIGMYDQTTCIVCVLDALDECRQQDRYGLIMKLTDFYSEQSSLDTTTGGFLKFLVTSRPYHDIESQFDKNLKKRSAVLPTIRIKGEDEHSQLRIETDLVMRQQVEDISNELNLSPEMKMKLLQRVEEIPNRTYLWSNLALDHFRHAYQNSLYPQHETVKSIPPTLAGAYSSILDKIPESNRKRAHQILQIVVGARRSLIISEMAIALQVMNHADHHYEAGAVNFDEHLGRYIRSWCGLFIFINDSHIYLIHQTAKEFLLGEMNMAATGEGGQYIFSTAEADLNMARICGGFMSTWSRGLDHQEIYEAGFSPVDFEDKLKEEQFWRYVIDYWPEHARCAQVCNVIFPSDPMYHPYQVDDSQHLAFFEVFWQLPWPYLHGEVIHNDAPQQWNSLRLAAFLQHELVVKQILQDEDVNVNSCDENEGTALIWAASRGNEAIVRDLLQHGADHNHRSRLYGNALIRALEGRHSKIVQILLEKGANPNIECGWPHRTTLHLSCALNDKESIQLLAEHGVDIDKKNSDTQQTAFLAAVQDSQAVICELLLRRGADVHLETPSGSTALHYASKRGSEKIVQLLLDHGLRVDASDMDKATPLLLAAERGHVKVVGTLLSRGAKPDGNKPRDTTPLIAATMNGHADVVKALITHGAQLDEISSYKGGGSALHAACRRLDISIMRSLLDHGADANIRDQWYASPLIVLCEGTYSIEAISTLLKFNADINYCSQAFGTPLQAAAANGHLATVEYLLQHGADIDASGGPHGTALSAAIKFDNLGIVEFLLSKGADTSFTNPMTSSTMLSLSRRLRNPSIIQMLKRYKKQPWYTSR